MKILLINKFLYPKGGDAIATLSTGKLLADRGHEVFYWGMNHPENSPYPYSEHFVAYIDYNKAIGKSQQIKDALNIIYSTEAKKKLHGFLEIVKPDIVHLNNFAHQISPSILGEIKKRRIPVVMTMHDYKLTCPSYTMLSNNKPCEKCSGGAYYHCFLGKCTKGSHIKSLINVIEMYLHHKVLHIYDKVDIFIAPSRFLMDKTKDMGLNGDITHLSNFVDMSKFEPHYGWKEKNIVFFGRLSQEKGLFTLLDAVKGLDIQLKIVGDGPLKEGLMLKVANDKLNNVRFLGYMRGNELHNEIRNCMAVVIPSEWYENNPISVLEAFALGKPVIGAKIGGIPELVLDRVTGLTFEPGNSVDLRNKIEKLMMDEVKVIEMGKKARALVEKEFNEEKYYKGLIAAYQRAAEKCNKSNYRRMEKN